MADFDRQLCEWRDSLPSHIRFGQHSADNFGEAIWITRARLAICAYFNHIYIVIHRPLLTVPYFSTPFLSSEASHKMGIRAAKESIGLIHSAFQRDPPLRKWPYYCYYIFMAELVLLTMLIKQPFAQEAREWASYCNMAIESFEWMMPLQAAKKSRSMSKMFVDEWKTRTEAGNLQLSEGVGPDKRRRSYNSDPISHIQPQNVSSTTPPHINYLLQSPPNTFQQSLVASKDFSAPARISSQGSDLSLPPLNPDRYDMRRPGSYSTTQTLKAAAAEALQSFSGTRWPNQGVFTGDGGVGWTYNFEDLFGDLSGGGMGGQPGL